jgi:predicted hydrolase (HD superfamily)
MNRDDAFALVCEYTQSLSLRRHMLGVESALGAYARRFEQDEALWRLVGLLHDFDYERWPILRSAAPRFSASAAIPTR